MDTALIQWRRTRRDNQSRFAIHSLFAAHTLLIFFLSSFLYASKRVVLLVSKLFLLSLVLVSISHPLTITFTISQQKQHPKFHINSFCRQNNSRWAVIDDDDRPSSLVTATSCWTQRANRFYLWFGLVEMFCEKNLVLVHLLATAARPSVDHFLYDFMQKFHNLLTTNYFLTFQTVHTVRPTRWRRLVSQSTASSTPCYCKAVAQQRAKFKPTHAAGPRPVMTSRRKQDRPRRVGVDRHRFRHKKASKQASKLAARLSNVVVGGQDAMSAVTRSGRQTD
ncbi:hypothetical protein T4D_2216 [Trichinella pseudospiralis]|uniref:Uncharacterized protein n=1 Tax=Trichinella pseudospiralis TaxID=6337 RepID=A0A0V1FVV8_TRIPS|nr:hypothetical protein T4D_2216 [Trichinella pseudospiralis]